MENMDKGLTVPKWVLIVWPKIPQMPQDLSAQIVCSSPKVWDFNEKRLNGRPLSVPHLINLFSKAASFFYVAEPRQGSRARAARPPSFQNLLLVLLWFCSVATWVGPSSAQAKGQIISEAIFLGFNSPKKQTKKSKGFLP